LDIRGLFKGVLSEHLQLPATFLERSVFPESAGAVAMRDLVKS